MNAQRFVFQSKSRQQEAKHPAQTLQWSNSHVKPRSPKGMGFPWEVLMDEESARTSNLKNKAPTWSWQTLSNVKYHGNWIYPGMITFPSSSAFYLNLQAMIEKKFRWQITLGWLSFSQKLFHYNPCRLLQRGQSPALYGAKKTFSPQKKTATPRFFFQISQHLAISTATVTPTVILCVIQKYEMQGETGLESELWMSCLHLEERVSTVTAAKDHLKAGLAPALLAVTAQHLLCCPRMIVVNSSP